MSPFELPTAVVTYNLSNFHKMVLGTCFYSTFRDVPRKAVDRSSNGHMLLEVHYSMESK